MAPQKIRRLIDPEDNLSIAPSPEVIAQPLVNTWQITDLPSRGLFYANTISGRPLEVLEVKRTTTITAENVDEIIDSILASVISGISPQNICVNDKLYILYWLRAQTFINDGFKVPYYCPHCKKIETYHFKISDMEQNFIAEDFDMSTFTFINPLDNRTITFLPRTIGDEQQVKYFIQNMKNTKLDQDILNIAIQIKTINGEPAKLEDSYNYLLSDPQSFAVVATYMSKAEFGLADNFKVTCSSCKEAGEVPISFQSNFMLPTYIA